jgi:phosphoglycolate phosphatase
MLDNIKAAIIDLDGTMLDTAPDFHVAVNRMRADLGLGPLAMQTIVDFVGKGSENLIRRVLAVDYDEDSVEDYF